MIPPMNIEIMATIGSEEIPILSISKIICL